MHNFGSFFLWALAACTLWNGSLASSLRSGYIFLLDDKSPNQPDSICVPELRSLLNDDVQAQNQGITNTCESDNEIKSKLERLEVKIGEVQAKLPQDVHAKLEGQLQGVENKLEGRLQGLEGQLKEVQTKLEAQQTKMEAKLEKSLHEVKTKLEGQLQGVESKLEGHLQEVQTKVEAKLDESLLAVQKMIENQFQAVVNQLQLVQNKIDVPKVVPPGFELIGNRYFRIVNEFENWETAERRCREMGGYLASFHNEDEINAITPKLLVWLYWIGINDSENEGHFVSVASHKPAPFLKWAAGEPSDRNHKENCVYLAEGIMGDYDCNESNEAYFICQADNET